MSFRVPPLLGALPLLGIAYLLPAGDGFGLWLRLVAATLVVLLPGRLVAHALGLRGAAPALAWTCALVAGALAITVALHGSLDLTLALVLATGAVAFFPAARRRQRPESPRVRGAIVLAGLALGGALWFIEGVVAGDALFHLGRIRKLDDLGALSLHAVGEFRRGGLHPGYAFPLWHAFLALVAKVGGVDPTQVALHESSILAPLALLLAFEMGVAVFRSTALGVATTLGQVALILLAPGNGGAYVTLWEPGTAARQLLVPAGIALFFRFVREPSLQAGATVAALAGSLTFVHPTYALFLWIPLAAFVVARAALARGADWREGLIGVAAFGLPTALVLVWLRPIARQSVSVNPGPKQLAASLAHYRHDLVVHSLHSYALAPEVVARTGSVAIAALVLVPVAVLARRRRWAAFVLGGAVAILALELWPFLFVRFSDAVSLSQSRRAAGFVPFAFAFAGGALVLARLSRVLALAAAVGLGIWLQLEYPGDFGLRTQHHAPAIAAWIALYGGAAALALGTALSGRRGEPGRRHRSLTALLAAALFVLPVAIHGFANWSAQTPRDGYALTPGLIRFLQRDVPARSVVLADLETSYRATAFAPLYAVGLPPVHVANTRPNQVAVRKRAVLRFFRQPSLALARTWHASVIVLRRGGPVAAVAALGVRRVYADDRYVVFTVAP
ncbi:MAG: hypothetical protein JO073_05980 [Actinobacteria bacterium]|nr:hypothetical protein [Actinomycetota bacterium]